MERIEINASSKYDVLVGGSIIVLLGAELKKIKPACRVMVVTDDKVEPILLKKVIGILSEDGYETESFIIPNGEGSKNKEVLFKLLEMLADKNFHRDDLVISLGGGVVGDITGFAASMYMRGIDFVQIPTTLLAMVDSSVGGKTAINLDNGKNLAGAFYQPRLVICDTDFLTTLDDDVFASGMAEVIKYGAIMDKELFEYLENNNASDNIDRIICRCIKDKRDIVISDEFDKGRRALLNFGHTIGHAIEKVSGYSISHGFAVGIGMVMISSAAFKAGLSENINTRLVPLLQEYNIPVYTEYNAEDLAIAALKDKKSDKNGINIILPQKIGEGRIYCASTYELIKIFELGVN